MEVFMNKKWFRLCRTLIMIAVAVAVGWSIAIGNALTPVFAVIGGMGLIYLCSKQVKEVTRDERNYRISEKASRFTLGICIPLIAIASAVFMALSKSMFVDLQQAGFTLAYSTCTIMVVYYAFYLYLNKRS
jgi:uncharacterized membrane protein